MMHEYIKEETSNATRRFSMRQESRAMSLDPKSTDMFALNISKLRLDMARDDCHDHSRSIALHITCWNIQTLGCDRIACGEML
jgi:hypothetical protein